MYEQVNFIKIINVIFIVKVFANKNSQYCKGKAKKLSN